MGTLTRYVNRTITAMSLIIFPKLTNKCRDSITESIHPIMDPFHYRKKFPRLEEWIPTIKRGRSLHHWIPGDRSQGRCCFACIAFLVASSPSDRKLGSILRWSLGFRRWWGSQIHPICCLCCLCFSVSCRRRRSLPWQRWSPPSFLWHHLRFFFNNWFLVKWWSCWW